MKFHFSLATLAALAAAAPTPDGAGTSGLKVDLTLVSNTQVKAVLTNTGKDDLKLLKTGTILSPAPVHKVRVTQNNEEVQFSGAFVRVMEALLDDTSFETLGAGKSLENVFDLSSMYDLSKGGEFTIQANDTIATGGANNKFAGSIQYTSNVLTTTVDGVKAAEDRVQAYSLVKRSKSSCSGGRRDVVNRAMQRCRELAMTAQYESGQGQASRMDEYFKRSDGATRATVSDVFRKVGEVCSTMNGGSSSLHCSDPHGGCAGGGAVAVTYPHESSMALCNAFFDSISPANNNCHSGDQGTVLIHEASHLREVKGTGDHGYGYDSVRSNSAETNLVHADAYTYFAKSFYESCSNDGDPGAYQVYICKDPRKGGGCIGVRGKLGSCTNVAPDFNDLTSSLGGSFQRECYAFKDYDCRGASFKINKGQQMDYLPGGFDDSISSVRC